MTITTAAEQAATKRRCAWCVTMQSVEDMERINMGPSLACKDARACNARSAEVSVSAERDMEARWLPAPSAVEHAVALLQAVPEADLAVIPMVQPGKTRGVWTAGQEVETVLGAVFLGVNGFDVPEGCPVPDYSLARHLAAETARVVLGGLPGTVARASVDRLGHAAVFED